MKNYMVKYIRRPRIARAWGKATKTHRLALVFATRDEAQAVYRVWRRKHHRLDSVFMKPADEPLSGVSVEDASRSLFRWQEMKR
ncbi:hypothetical protein LCGC14_2212670 [marine sediment metagenome]|uniref:AP2/ERF domain-containing protein n=1 Tax=marine sediment metagenome TaxID=412755 RepID=A0A0F9G8Z4_9ZZZZ